MKDNVDLGPIERAKDDSTSTKTKYFSFQKVPSKFLQNMPSLKLQLHKHRMELRRNQLKDLLSRTDLSKEKREKILRL